MQTTYSQTGGWLWNTKYEYRVRAMNTLGPGVMSSGLVLKTPINPALLTLPSGMSTPILTMTTAFLIGLSWSELTDSRNGGDTPIYYQL